MRVRVGLTVRVRDPVRGRVGPKTAPIALRARPVSVRVRARTRARVRVRARARALVGARVRAWASVAPSVPRRVARATYSSVAATLRSDLYRPWLGLGSGFG